MGLSLIAAIGAQNAFVLRQGLRREHVGVVIAMCCAFDATFIVLGIATIGWVSGLHPNLLDVLRYAGAAYLLWFAFTSFRSAFRSFRNPQSLEAGDAPGGGATLRKVVLPTYTSTPWCCWAASATNTARWVAGGSRSEP